MKSLESMGLTIGAAAKIVSAVVLLVGYTVGVYGYVEHINQKTQLLKQETNAQQQLIQAKVDNLNNEQAIKHKAIEQSLQTLSEQVAGQEKATTELTVAVQKATIIMERLDAKLGRP